MGGKLTIKWSATTDTEPFAPIFEGVREVILVAHLTEGEDVAEELVEDFFNRSDQADTWHKFFGDDADTADIRVTIAAPEEFVGIYAVQMTRKVKAVAFKVEPVA